MCSGMIYNIYRYIIYIILYYIYYIYIYYIFILYILPGIYYIHILYTRYIYKYLVYIFSKSKPHLLLYLLPAHRWRCTQRTQCARLVTQIHYRVCPPRTRDTHARKIAKPSWDKFQSRCSPTTCGGGNTANAKQKKAGLRRNILPRDFP